MTQNSPSAARRNINRVAELEAEFEEKRSRTDRVVGGVAGWTGSLSFLFLHLTWFVAWVIINATSLLPIKRFDPFPFVLLSVCVSCEAVLLSTMVLMKQNWGSKRDERRAHLQLQINLLAEQEVTKLLYLQQLVCRKLDIREADQDPEVEDFSRETAVADLAEEISAKQPID